MVIKNSNQYFHACDGAELKDVKDMLNWMRNSSDDAFNNHINSDRNDFIEWIKEILKDNVLVKKIDGLKNREEIIDVIEKYIESKLKSKNKKKSIISQLKMAILNGSS